MENYISINFIYIRKKNGYERKGFAEKYGISYGAMSSYERDISLPPIDLVQRICNDLKINIDDFVNKDLSELDKKNYYAEEPSDIYRNAKEKIQLYQRIIKSKEEIIETQAEHITLLKDILNEKNKTN